MVEKKKVPKGYKMTEVGIIPEDWEVQCLGINSSLKARIGWQGLTTTEYLKNGDYYLITGTDFKNGKIDWENCYFVKKKRYEQDKNIQVKKGDVLITKDGTIGKIAYIDNLSKEATLNSGVFVVRPLKDAYVPKYLYYMLMSDLFKDFLDKLAAGSTITHLYQKDFNDFKFPVPCLEEQNVIAEALSDIDNLIISLEKLIDKKQKIKQGTMQQLLTGKKRLPEFVGEWVVKKLGEIVIIRKGHQKNKDTFSNKGEYPVINGGIEPSGYTSDWNTEENTITISEGGNSCGYVNFIKTKFWSGGHCYTVQIKDGDLNNSFLYYLLKYYELKIMALRVGSGLPNIQRKSIEEFEITYIEGTQEQKAIAQILSEMDSEIETLEKKLEKYKAIKQGMMQELLTGRIRLV